MAQGVGTDVQAFGYDESEVGEPKREALRSEWRGYWRAYRQELFVNREGEPFAVVEWKHTVQKIEVIRVAGRPSLRTNMAGYRGAVGDTRPPVSR